MPVSMQYTCYGVMFRKYVLGSWHRVGCSVCKC